MKFSFLLSNPPYNRALHEHFLEHYLDIADHIITIQPTSWLLGEHPKKRLTKKIDSLSTTIETVNGIATFDAGIGNQIAIYDITHKDPQIIYDGKHYDKCEDITKVSNDPLMSEFKDIITSSITESVHDNLRATLQNPVMSMAKKREYIENRDQLTVEIPTIRGHLVTSGSGKHDDFYTMFSRDDNVNYRKITKPRDWPTWNKIEHAGRQDEKCILSKIYVKLDTELECKNFIRYMKTDFARACMYLKKDGQILVTKALILVPWQDFTLNIFTHEIHEIDDYLFKKYNIKEEIVSHIREILPDYYNIR